MNMVAFDMMVECRERAEKNAFFGTLPCPGRRTFLAFVHGQVVACLTAVLTDKDAAKAEVRGRAWTALGRPVDLAIVEI